jgi:hypothetical protein
MRKALLLALAFGLPAAIAADEAKGKPVEAQVHSGYFEKNNAGLKGEASYLAFTDKDAFDKIFGTAVVMGKKPNFLAKDAFDNKLVVAVIKRGDAVTEYDVEKVTADNGKLYVQYKAKTKGSGGTARYASPLIVSVDRGKYNEVEFIENGKKVGSAKMGK